MPATVYARGLATELEKCEVRRIENHEERKQARKKLRNDLAIKTAFLIKSKISEIRSSKRTQHQHKQNRYSLYRSLDSSIVLKYPAIAITIKAIYKSSF